LHFQQPDALHAPPSSPHGDDATDGIETAKNAFPPAAEL